MSDTSTVIISILAIILALASVVVSVAGRCRCGDEYQGDDTVYPDDFEPLR